MACRWTITVISATADNVTISIGDGGEFINGDPGTFNSDSWGGNFYLSSATEYKVY